MVSITNRARSVFFNERLRPLGLSAGQFPVLLLLAKEQNITQETLVRHYHLDKGTIARAVKKLENGGYIRRITDPENRRAVRLFLTRKGEQMVPVIQEINSAWEASAFRGIRTSEQDSLRLLMLAVAKNSLVDIRDAGGVSDDSE
jgi:MarR family transcriptional regulator, temperature-dependent positive regulator of motility